MVSGNGSVVRLVDGNFNAHRKGWSLTSNAGRDDMIFDPPKFQIPKI